jgi:hypothetical protein
MKPTLHQLRQLIGNPVAYAVQRTDGSWYPVREPLDDAVLREHLAGRKTVGTYVGHQVDGQTMARTLVFDIDEDNEQLAKQVQEALYKLGIAGPSSAIEFSGRKGYHVWVVLHAFQPSHELRRVGRAALALAGLPANTEVFPKQDEVRELGNLVKLPGGVHQVSGKHNDFITPFPIVLNRVRWQRVMNQLPEEQRARHAQADERFPCLASIQCGVSEGGRNHALFQLATMVRRGGLNDEMTRLVVEAANEKCEPPLDPGELEALLDSSAHSGPICSQLPSALQEACGEYCIRERVKGLFSRPGQLRHAAEGEYVVLRVGSRAANTVTLEHDDAEGAKAVLRERND